jgi:cytoskeletal protein RodZ
VMHPVGPLNPRVYWIRRVMIVVLAVAVLIGVVWFLANRNSRSSAGQDTAAAVAQSSAAPTLTGVLAASSGPSRSTVASPTPTSAPASSSPAVSDTAAPDAAASSAATTDPAATTPDPAADAAAAAAAATPTTDPAASAPAEPSPAPAPAPPPPPPPSYDAQGRLICPAAAITVTATTVAPSFAAGSQPMLGMTVTNSGAETCQLDVSGTLQIYTVTAADGTRVWSTADCFPGEGTEVRELAPAQTLEYKIKWSGTTSAPGCEGERTPVGVGDYSVVAQLGGITSQPTPFAITG